MEKHEMMSLEDSGQLRDKIRFFEQELLKNHHIDPNLYVEYNVKRGLRDSAGKGVLTGLTEISDVNGYNLINGRQIPADGRLYYQGINVQDIISGLNGRRFGFEETIYLLIFGKLPDKEELSRFLDMMSDMEELGGRFVRDVVMKGTNANIMNAMQRCVLALYTYDDNPEDISPENVLRQSLELIAKLPEIAVYSYHAYRHFRKDDTLFIRNPQKGLSLAENILLMLRPDGKYTELEAKVLDIALILHAEHGGGNNSTFTTHVVTSSGTDTYSSTAASIGSLKGPRHGGANLKVQNMFADLKSHVDQDHWDNEDEIITYLKKVLNKEAFDHAGLIYGMGHAVYTLSDPREVILKRFAQALAEEKGMVKYIPASVGFLLGIGFLLLLDSVIPHLHLDSNQPEGVKSSLSKSTMLVLAVTLHNIPEGMAVGITFASAMMNDTSISVAGAFSLAVGIAIQNFPEGAIISLPLKDRGMNKGKAFVMGVLSGVVEPIGAVLTLVFASMISSILPYFLSFAAGAMIYVVTEELIPESQQGKHSNIGTIGVAVGFVVMMVLDSAFG